MTPDSIHPPPPGRGIPPHRARRYIKDLLRRHDISPRKALGQHFMVNDVILDALVAACNLTPRTVVVEVGPGIGNLSTRLAEQAGRVIALEIDPAFQRLHDRIASACPNLSFVRCDALKWDWDDTAGALDATDLVIAGNIPYQITSPLIQRLIQSPLPWRAAVLTMQREVAERLCAPPGPKAYGALTLKTRLIAETEVLQTIGPENFYPPPEIESAMVRLNRRPACEIDGLPERLRFFRLCDGLFAHRRKQAPNSLSAAGTFGLGQDAWKRAIEGCGFDPERRGETYSLAEALQLNAAVARAKNH